MANLRRSGEILRSPISTSVPSAKTKGASKQSNSAVVVMPTHNRKGKRTFDKIVYCPFCQTKQARLTRHLASFNNHHDEVEIVEWRATVDKKLKAKRLTRMRNYGNYLHNEKVLKEQKGELIVVYRPGHEAAPENYGPCPDCLGYYSISEIWKHRCLFREEPNADGEPSKKRQRNWRRESRMLLPRPEVAGITRKVLSSLRSDEEGVAVLIKSETMMAKLADKFTFKLRHDKDQFNDIRAKLREVGRTVLAYRQVSGVTNAQLPDLIEPQVFMKVMEATRQVAGYHDNTQLYDTPSLALKIGHSLMKVAEIMQCEALISHDAALEKRSKGFIDLYRMKWGELVSHHALRSKPPKYLPVTEDVCKLPRYIKKEVSEEIQALKTNRGNSGTVEQDDVKHVPGVPPKAGIKTSYSTRKIAGRRTWTEVEQTVVKKRLRGCFQQRRLPSKMKCLNLITSESVLQGRKWENIKDFVRNWLRYN
eukprot:XP_011684045.1 PREDICTED: uncharacterized protein LOC105447544 [Strongylocentrotus purpuratus]